MNGHNNNNNNNNTDSGRMNWNDTMFQCPDCGVLVPPSNVALHHLRSCIRSPSRHEHNSTFSSSSSQSARQQQHQRVTPAVVATNATTTNHDFRGTASATANRPSSSSTSFGAFREPRSNKKNSNNTNHDDNDDDDDNNKIDDDSDLEGVENTTTTTTPTSITHSPPHKRPRAIVIDRVSSDSTEGNTSTTSTDGAPSSNHHHGLRYHYHHHRPRFQRTLHDNHNNNNDNSHRDDVVVDDDDDDNFAQVVDYVNLYDNCEDSSTTEETSSTSPVAAAAAAAASTTTTTARGFTAAATAAARTTSVATTSSAVDLTSGDDSFKDERDVVTTETAPTDNWACPQCTLWNPNYQPTCEVCAYRNPNYVRPPDPTRTERLVGGQPQLQPQRYAERLGLGGIQSTTTTTPSSMVGRGVLAGGIMGAAANWITGRDPIRGAIEGGTMGGIGGVFLHDAVAMRSNPPPPPRRRTASTSTTGPTITHVVQSRSNNDSGGGGTGPNRYDVASARTSVTMGMASYPSMGRTDGGDTGRNSISDGRQLARPRGSLRVVRTVSANNGTEQVVVSEGSTTTRITRRRDNNNNNTRPSAFVDPGYDPIFDYLLHTEMLQQRRGYGGSFGRDTAVQARFGVLPNLDSMNYEQLLQAFGDGTENLGADGEDILQLPTRVIQDPIRELPEEARQCMICLEDYEKGDTRITLPCLHGFHEGCGHKWLHTNGCCPVCKHRLTKG